MTKINDIEKLIAEISGLLDRLKAVDRAATDLYSSLRTSKPNAGTMSKLHDSATRLVRLRRIEDQLSACQYKARAMSINYQQLVNNLAAVREDLRGYEYEVKS